MSDSTNNNQPIIPAVSELPSYTDLGNRSQFESLVNLNAPPAQQTQAQQPAFSQSMPPTGCAYNSQLGYPGRPIYYKPASHQPVYMPYQPQQFQPSQQFVQPIVQNVPYQQEAARNLYLKDAYPVGYVVFHNVFLILLSLVIVTIQTLLIFNNAFTSFVGGGCWAGAWLLFTAIFSLSSVGCKSNCTIISSVVFQLLGIVFTGIGCVIMSGVNLSGDMPCWDGYDYCDKTLVWQLCYALASVGLVIMIFCLVFSVFILVRFVRARKQFDAHINMQYNMFAHHQQQYQQQQQQQHGQVNPNYGWVQPTRYNNQTQRLV